MSFICSCEKENHLFENCIFPYDEVDLYLEDAMTIPETELPIEITQDIRNTNEKVSEIRGAVINNCLRENFLLVNVERRIFVAFGTAGETREIETDGNFFSLYDNCGDFLGTLEEEDSGAIRNLESEFAEILDRESNDIDDVFRLDFVDGSKDFLIEVSYRDNGERVYEYHYLNIESRTSCQYSF